MNKTQYPPQSGRIVGEDNAIYNIVELFKAVGSRASPIDNSGINITQFSPRSGRIVGEDGKFYNMVDLLGGIKTAIDSIVVVAASTLELPETGEIGTLYVVTEKDKIYRWDENDMRYVCIGSNEMQEYELVTEGESLVIRKINDE